MENGKWKMLCSKGGRLTERKLTGAALLLFDVASDLQQTVKHFGALGASSCELGVGLLVEAFQTVQFVGNVQGREDGHFEGINSQGAGRNFPHATVDKFSELNDVFCIAVRANVVS